jgi:hypothetical protein
VATMKTGPKLLLGKSIIRISHADFPSLSWARNLRHYTKYTWYLYLLYIEENSIMFLCLNNWPVPYVTVTKMRHMCRSFKQYTTATTASTLMPYHLHHDEIQLLLDLFDSLRSQAATTSTLTSSLELLNLRLRLSLSSDSQAGLDSDSCYCCLKTYSDDLGPPTEDNTLVQPVSFNFLSLQN